MATSSITIVAAGLKPLTVHTLKVGDAAITSNNIQVSGQRRGEGDLTSDAGGKVTFTVFLDDAGTVTKRTVVLSAPFSQAAGEFTF